MHSRFPLGPGRKTRPVSKTPCKSLRFFWLWARTSANPGSREGRTCVWSEVKGLASAIFSLSNWGAKKRFPPRNEGCNCRFPESLVQPGCRWLCCKSRNRDRSPARGPGWTDPSPKARLFHGYAGILRPNQSAGRLPNGRKES